MASIQIRADIVTIACEKSLAKCESRRKNIAECPVKDEHVIFWSHDGIDKKSKLIMKIKKMAECAKKNEEKTEPSEKDIINCVLTAHEDATITIDHNDFELIGEFL